MDEGSESLTAYRQTTRGKHWHGSRLLGNQPRSTGIQTRQMGLYQADKVLNCK